MVCLGAVGGECDQNIIYEILKRSIKNLKRRKKGGGESHWQ